MHVLYSSELLAKAVTHHNKCVFHGERRAEGKESSCPLFWDNFFLFFHESMLYSLIKASKKQTMKVSKFVHLSFVVLRIQTL